MSAGSPVVGVVGDGLDDLAARIERAGGRVETGTADTVLSADVDVVVTGGETTTLSVARTSPAVPLVPVAVGRGLRSVPAEATADVAEALVDRDWVTETHPIVAIERAGSHIARTVMDVTLVTAEAARISEFSVTAGDTHVGQFRADGVVVATPAGTPGYARRIDTPIVAPATDVLAVAPIAPFTTDPDHWIVPDDHLEVTIERDEAAVTLVADDRSVGPIDPDEPVTLSTAETVTVAVLDDSQPRFP
jgi:NAD+ kinase